MVGLYLTIFLSGCLLNTLAPAVAYRLDAREEGVPTNNHVESDSEGEHEDGRHGEGRHGDGRHDEESHDEEHFPSQISQAPGSHSNNMQGTETFNHQGQGTSNYHQENNQVPNYQQGQQYQNYQQETGQTPNNQEVGQYQNYQQQAPNYQQRPQQGQNYQQQVPNYQQGPQQGQHYQQGPNYQPNYQQGQAQNPNYQQEAPYNEPNQKYSQQVLSSENPDELVKNKSESELRKLVLVALKEMKEIADKVMFWHKDHNGDKHESHDDAHSQEHQNVQTPQQPLQQQPQAPYTNPPAANQQQYYNQNPQTQPQNGYIQTNPEQYYGTPQQNQQVQPQYISPNYVQPGYNQVPFQQYRNPFRQPQYNPQPNNNQQQQSQPTIVIPPGTLQYQRLVQRLYANLSPLPGQQEGLSQQFFTYKLWSVPQQQPEGQLTDPQQPSSDTQQPQISIPVTTDLVKSVFQLQPSAGIPVTSYIPPLIHVPPGFVVVSPTHYVFPYQKLPQVSGFRSHFQYGFPILMPQIHDYPQ